MLPLPVPPHALAEAALHADQNGAAAGAAAAKQAADDATLCGVHADINGCGARHTLSATYAVRARRCFPARVHACSCGASDTRLTCKTTVCTLAHGQRRTLHTDRYSVLRTGATPAEALSAALAAQLGRVQVDACASTDFAGVREGNACAEAELHGGASISVSHSHCCGDGETLLSYVLPASRSAGPHCVRAVTLSVPSDERCALQLRQTQRHGRRTTRTCVRLDAAGGVHLSRELLSRAAQQSGGEARPDGKRVMAAAGAAQSGKPEERDNGSRVLLQHTLRGRTELAGSGALRLGTRALLRYAARAHTQPLLECSATVRRFASAALLALHSTARQQRN
jgi:hypothetical protein